MSSSGINRAKEINHDRGYAARHCHRGLVGVALFQLVLASRASLSPALRIGSAIAAILVPATLIVKKRAGDMFLEHIGGQDP